MLNTLRDSVLSVIGGGRESLPVSEETDVSQVSTKPRVDYVDLVKGITIIWIIWIHTDCPDFGGYRNPIFFFASGIFFKLSEFSSFFKKRLKNILLPLLFFFFASLPFRLIVHYWDNRTLSTYDWSVLGDLFTYASNHDYLALNVPLWFLMALFTIQISSFFILRLPKIVILSLSLMSFFFMTELRAWPTYFMFNQACVWFGYFSVGFLFGKPLIRIMNTYGRKAFVLVVSLMLIMTCIGVEKTVVSEHIYLVEQFKYLAFIVMFMAAFSFFNGCRHLEVLRFFGKNSLVVLVMHLWILVPIERIMFKVTRVHDPALGLFMACTTAVILIPVIVFMNRKLPFLIGK